MRWFVTFVAEAFTQSHFEDVKSEITQVLATYQRSPGHQWFHQLIDSLQNSHNDTTPGGLNLNYFTIFLILKWQLLTRIHTFLPQQQQQQHWNYKPVTSLFINNYVFTAISIYYWAYDQNIASQFWIYEKVNQIIAIEPTISIQWKSSANSWWGKSL